MNFVQQTAWKSYLKTKGKPKRKKDNSERNKRASLCLMEDQRRLNNPNEEVFRRLLIEYGIKHVWQQPFSCADRYVCTDFYLPIHNVVIEIDGLKHNHEKDTQRTHYLKRVHGISKVLRITNTQLATNRNQVIDLVIEKFTK